MPHKTPSPTTPDMTHTMFDQTPASPGPGTNSPDVTNIDSQSGSAVHGNNSPDTPSFENRPASPDLPDTPKLLTQYTEGKNPAKAYADAVKEATLALQLVHKASRDLAQDHASFLAFQKTQNGTDAMEKLQSSRPVFTQKLYLPQMAELHDSLASIIELDRAIAGSTKLRGRLATAQAKSFVHNHGLKGAFALLINSLLLTESSLRWDLLVWATSTVMLPVVMALLFWATGHYLTGEVGAVAGWTLACLLLGFLGYAVQDEYLGA